jgi:signal transduction histidine kinase
MAMKSAADQLAGAAARQRVIVVLDAYSTHGVDEANALRNEIVAMVRCQDDPALLVEALLWNNFRLAVRGRSVEAAALREAARDVATAARHAASLALCDVCDAGADYTTNHLAEAVVKVKRAWPALIAQRNPHRCQTVALRILANVYVKLHLFDEAIAATLEARQIERAAGDSAGAIALDASYLKLTFDRACSRYPAISPLPAADPDFVTAEHGMQQFRSRVADRRGSGMRIARETLFQLFAITGRDDEALSIWAEIDEIDGTGDAYPQLLAIAALLSEGPARCLEKLSVLIDQANESANLSELEDLWAVRATAHQRQGDYRSALAAAHRYRTLALDQSRNVARSQGALFAIELEAERETALAQRALVYTGKLAAVGRLASSVAHEVSQPVAALMLLTHEARGLVEARRFEQLDEVVDDVVAQSERVSRLTGRMQDFSHDEPLRLRPLDLRHVIEEARRLCQPAIAAAQVGFDIHVPEVVVTVDKERLIVAVVNLVVNALDAMQGQTSPAPLLRIQARQQPGAAPDVRLDVVDTGPGLSEEAQAKLFQPFFTTKATGLGLGLTIARQVLEAMGSRLEGRNEPGRGARFSVVLQRAKVPSLAELKAHIDHD